MDVASAIAGLGAGLTGRPNPVQSQDEQRLRSYLLFSMTRARLGELRRRQNEAHLSSLETLLQNDSPEVRKWAAPQYGRAYQATYGEAIPPVALTNLATRRIKPEVERQMLGDLDAHLPDPYLMQTYHVAPEELAQYKQALTQPGYRKTRGLPPIDQAEIEAMTRERQRLSLWYQEHDIKPGSDFAESLNHLAQQSGRPLYAVTSDEMPALQLKARAELAARDQEKSDRIKKRELELEAARQKNRLALAQVKLEQKGRDPKTVATVRSALTLAKQLKDAAHRLAGKGMLSRRSDRLSLVQPMLKRFQNPGDPDLALFDVHGSTMVSLGRAVGDIGGRAQAAYQTLMDVVEHPTSVGAVDAPVDAIVEGIIAGHPDWPPELFQVSGASPSLSPAGGPLHPEVTTPPGFHKARP